MTDIEEGWTHCQACGQEIEVCPDLQLRTVCEFRSVAASFCGLQKWPGRQPLELWTAREFIAPLSFGGFYIRNGSTVSAETLRKNRMVPVPVIA